MKTTLRMMLVVGLIVLNVMVVAYLIHVGGNVAR